MSRVPLSPHRFLQSGDVTRGLLAVLGELCLHLLKLVLSSTAEDEPEVSPVTTHTHTHIHSRWVHACTRADGLGKEANTCIRCMYYSLQFLGEPPDLTVPAGHCFRELRPHSGRLQLKFLQCGVQE